MFIALAKNSGIYLASLLKIQSGMYSGCNSMGKNHLSGISVGMTISVESLLIRVTLSEGPLARSTSEAI